MKLSPIRLTNVGHVPRLRDMTKTMTKIDKVVREAHEAREGHPCEGYWTERTYDADTMHPRRFIPTCCGRR